MNPIKLAASHRSYDNKNKHLPAPPQNRTEYWANEHAHSHGGGRMSRTQLRRASAHAHTAPLVDKNRPILHWVMRPMRYLLWPQAAVWWRPSWQLLGMTPKHKLERVAHMHFSHTQQGYGGPGERTIFPQWVWKDRPKPVIEALANDGDGSYQRARDSCGILYVRLR